VTGTRGDEGIPLEEVTKDDFVPRAAKGWFERWGGSSAVIVILVGATAAPPLLFHPPNSCHLQWFALSWLSLENPIFLPLSSLAGVESRSQY